MDYLKIACARSTGENCKIRNLGSILIILLLLSGCTLPFQKETAPDESWKQEVIYATECGLEGMACCADAAEQCKYGNICCADPNDPGRNMCGKSCDYGKKDNFCRTGNECDGGLACAKDLCVPCGSADSPCCAGSKCDGDLVCYQDECKICGQWGSPCCDTGLKCENQDRRDANRSECQDNLCVLCGSDSKLACKAEPKCNKGLLMNGSGCMFCGGVNQPCCNQLSGSDYECDPGLGLKCEAGFCGK